MYVADGTTILLASINLCDAYGCQSLDAEIALFCHRQLEKAPYLCQCVRACVCVCVLIVFYYLFFKIRRWAMFKYLLIYDLTQQSG